MAEANEDELLAYDESDDEVRFVPLIFVKREGGVIYAQQFRAF